MIRTEDGLLVFARRPCRTGCSHADEAFTPEELEREREKRQGSRRALSLREESEIARLYRPGSAKGKRPTNAHSLADRFRVSSRTIHRVAARARGRAHCPGADGEGCLVVTPGGRLCGFCRRTEALPSGTHPGPVPAASVEL
jgi:hypothetical protein